jgi:hypothetical protein
MVTLLQLLIKFNKLSKTFSFLKLLSGSSILTVRYNEFFEKSDPFGIKLNSFNFKKLREGRTGITFLRMLRRASKDSYSKFTKFKEVQFNLLYNEHLYAEKYGSSVKIEHKNLNVNEINFDGFNGVIHRKLSNFHLYHSKLFRVRGWTNSNLILRGYSDSYSLDLCIRSLPYYNRLVIFGKKI